MSSPIERRVWGPPGTGKTTNLVDAATQMVDRVGDDQVSICSLTNAAIREATSRSIPIDPENLTTLHARCKRSLDAPGPAESSMAEFLMDFKKYDNDFSIPPTLRDRTEEDKNERAMMGGLTYFDRAQIYRQQMIPESEWENEKVIELNKDWLYWCRSKGIMDFTGWLEAAMEARSLPRQYIVYVDEAQDHTPLQLAVLRNWNTKHLVLIGDDDQNLYEWSGAIPDRFYTPELAPDRERVLGQSYRVPREIHKLASIIVSKIIKRRPKSYAPRDFDGSVIKSPYRLKEAREGAPMIELGYVDDDKTQMILASCAYMLEDVIAFLRSTGVPFYNPYRRSNHKWNPIGSKAANNAKGYLLDEWTGSVIHDWARILKAREVFHNREEFLTFCKENSKREISPEEIRPYLLDANAELVLSRNPKTLIDLRLKSTPGSWDYYTRVFKPGKDYEPKIIVGTIHSVKGGEADIIHLFPDLSFSGHNETYENPDRIHRLFYVGVTRAKESVIVHEASSPKAYNILGGERG